MKAYMKIGLSALLGATVYTSVAQAGGDVGHYITRKPVVTTYKELDQRNTNIRDLITDCKERSISLSCHRAGKWFYDTQDTNNGFYFMNRSCALGRGYSCRYIADKYLRAEQNNEAIRYYKKGCLRQDNKSCELYASTPPSPKPKGFFETFFVGNGSE